MSIRIFGAALLGVAMLTVGGAPAASAAGMLVDPSGDALCLLAYKLANQAPPLDDFAAQATAVQRADEFDRQKATDAEKSRLTALVTSLATVTTIRVNIDMSMGEYDSDLGEYDLSGFGADEYVPFTCFQNHQVRLRLDNAPYAQSWSLDPTAAEAALTRNKGSRNVVAITTVAITGVDSTAPGDPMVLVGDATDVAVVGEYTHLPLGHYAVKAQ